MTALGLTENESVWTPHLKFQYIIPNVWNSRKIGKTKHWTLYIFSPIRSGVTVHPEVYISFNLKLDLHAWEIFSPYRACKYSRKVWNSVVTPAPTRTPEVLISWSEFGISYLSNFLFFFQFNLINSHLKFFPYNIPKSKIPTPL